MALYCSVVRSDETLSILSFILSMHGRVITKFDYFDLSSLASIFYIRLEETDFKSYQQISTNIDKFEQRG